MNFTRTLLALAGTSSLALFLACSGGGGGGGTTTPSATSLSYTDPTSGTWQLKKDSSSTPTHLVLNLVATSAGTGAGVAVELTVDTSKATWSKVLPGDAEYVHNGSVLTLGSGTQAIKGKVSTATLQFAVSQKGLGSPATLNGTVAQIALDLTPGTAPGAVSLAPVSGKTKSLNSAGTIADITVTTGTLTAN